MVVVHTGRLPGNPDHEEELVNTLNALNEYLAHLTTAQEIHVGTSPPPKPWGEGDMWYDPVENRYRGYVEG